MCDSQKESPRFHPSLIAAVERLIQMEAPLLTFAQTVFWDDPMKATFLKAARELRAPLRFIVGIHDTDYFSKLPQLPLADTPFVLVSRNDTTTKELWAATAEAAALFGSETPVPIAQLLAHQVPLAQLCARKQRRQREDEDDTKLEDCDLDHLTEAWGWRAVAFRGEHAPVACEVRVAEVIKFLAELLNWAISETLAIVCPDEADVSSAHHQAAQTLKEILQSEAAKHPEESLTVLYRAVTARLYQWLLDGTASEAYNAPGFETTACSTFFRFSPATCDRLRFRVLDLFLRPESRPIMVEEYDQAVSGSGIYFLERFGKGALPFDLFVPGQGRGTLRVEAEQCVVHFHDKEIVVGTGSNITSSARLAEVIASRFGDHCALLGKAVVLPTMFAAEGVMLLNEGASAYIPRTQAWVRALRRRGIELPLKPLLRLRYHTLDALASLDKELHLPRHLQDTFCFRSNPYPARKFAERWREVIHEQRKQLEMIAEIRSSRDLIPFLAINSTCGPSEKWYALQDEYHTLLKFVHRIGAQLTDLSVQIALLKERVQEKKRRLSSLEAESGRLRRLIASNTGSPEEERLLQAREQILRQLHEERACLQQLAERRRHLSARADELRLDAQFLASKERLREIELEAEEQRLRLTRNALLTLGLERVNRRPCAWWFPLVDPSLRWWDEVTRSTEAYFEEW